MTDSLDVSTTGISTQAAVFRDVSGDLSDAVQRLRTCLAGLGDVAGGDDPGRKFASRYDPNTATIEANVDKLVDATMGMSEGLASAASGYAAMDAANCDSLRPRTGGQ